MVDDFSTYFIAGQETTSNTLAFCFQELARHPQVLKRLRCEIDSVLGSKNHIDFEDLTKMNYLNCVYKETLRLWPPIPEIARLIEGDFSVEGYKVPEKTWLQLSTYVSGRQRHYFTDPDEFKPERFFVEEKSGEYVHSIQNYTYFPFSLGPRSCIGQNFAKVILK
jgi:cholesterol 24(S)-hydroxylase